LASLIAYDARKPHPFTSADYRIGVASFLCPICAKPLFGEAGVDEDPCSHVLVTFNSSGAVRCRDPELETVVSEEQKAARAGGRDPMEGLRARLGPHVVFFELLDQPPGATEVEVFTFVIDLAPSPA